jgi:hypothetical protein
MVLAVGGDDKLAFAPGTNAVFLHQSAYPFLAHAVPRATSSFHILGQPYSPLTSAWMARMWVSKASSLMRLLANQAWWAWATSCADRVQSNHWHSRPVPRRPR